MASNQEHNDSTEGFVTEPMSDINPEGGATAQYMDTDVNDFLIQSSQDSSSEESLPEDGASTPFMDTDVNELLRQSSQDSSDSSSEELLSREELLISDSGVIINGTMFKFQQEFHDVFDKLFYYSTLTLRSPPSPECIFHKHLRFRNRFVEHKCSREYIMEPIASTQRIVAHILSIMPAQVKQILTRKIVTKNLTQRLNPGPSQYSARRPRSDYSEDTYHDFFSYFAESTDSIGMSSTDSEDRLTVLYRTLKRLEDKCLKSMIANLTFKVLTDLEMIKDLADVTLRQFESGDGLDLEKTIEYLVGYDAIRKDYGTKDEIYEELAVVVASDCEKHLRCIFTILDLRNLMDLYDESRSRILYAIFLLKIQQKIDTEVKDISMNIRSLVRTAKNFIWTKEE